MLRGCPPGAGEAGHWLSRTLEKPGTLGTRRTFGTFGTLSTLGTLELDVVDTGSSRLALVISPGCAGLEATAAALAGAWIERHPSAHVVVDSDAATWPFRFPLVPELDPPIVVWVPEIHEAFVNQQTGNTRLVTTQASYLIQTWLDAIGDREILLVATADRDSLQEHAPEVPARRGGFASALIYDASEHFASPRAPEVPSAKCPVHRALPGAKSPERELLATAFRSSDPGQRLRLCVRALGKARTPAALVATASVCMEVSDLVAAARDLDEALGLAPEWPAAHFERGKLWLRLDDMDRASESFREAATRMPRFASSWANLGATLGELDRPEEALPAFEQALKCDPTNQQALNNVGVVSRELGKLADAEAAFRRVTTLAADLAFGYYNLGHTLFLQGRYQAALGAYLDGQRRDPERNPVQASRLALCRLATGDANGALAELQRATGALPREYRGQLLADTNAIAWALLTHRPNLPGWKEVNDWLAGELAKLA